MCGFKFDETKVPNGGCANCGKHCSNTVHCPNCGYANSLDFEEECAFIKKLKDKFNSKKASH